MRITTKDMADAMRPVYPASEKMVREWCEEGLLPNYRNPLPGRTKARFFIVPGGVRTFLVEVMAFEPEHVDLVLARLGFNFSPGSLNRLIAS